VPSNCTTHVLFPVCSCRQLQSLSITGVPRLRDKALGPLAGLADRLQHLDLSGCSGVTSRSLAVLRQLTALHSLVLTGKCKQEYRPDWEAQQHVISWGAIALAHTAGASTFYCSFIHSICNAVPDTVRFSCPLLACRHIRQVTCAGPAHTSVTPHPPPPGRL
jgi:hypothetical protein